MNDMMKLFFLHRKFKICVRIRLVDAGTDEIVCAVITNLKNIIRHHVGDSRKIAAVEFRR